MEKSEMYQRITLTTQDSANLRRKSEKMREKAVRMPFEVSFDLFVQGEAKGNHPIACFATQRQACNFASYAAVKFPSAYERIKGQRRYRVKREGKTVFVVKWW